MENGAYFRCTPRCARSKLRVNLSTRALRSRFGAPRRQNVFAVRTLYPRCGVARRRATRRLWPGELAYVTAPRRGHDSVWLFWLLAAPDWLWPRGLHTSLAGRAVRAGCMSGSRGRRACRTSTTGRRRSRARGRLGKVGPFYVLWLRMAPWEQRGLPHCGQSLPRFAKAEAEPATSGKAATRARATRHTVSSGVVIQRLDTPAGIMPASFMLRRRPRLSREIANTPPPPLPLPWVGRYYFS